MTMQNPERVVTKKDLKDFYDEIFPFLGGRVNAGFTPIGTIIPMIAETTPANYLICNGATYNKSDYPELASHLLSMTNHSMYEVSGDATKFKVPDLRGEFLRGTGTNSHASSGDGAAVGIHQDATEHVWFGMNTTSSYTIWTDSNQVSKTGGSGIKTSNPDKYIQGAEATTKGLSLANNTFKTEWSGASGYTNYTARPTNTSVLFCIATKNIYLDPKNDYSTEEKVIGTWIDGATIYQRTFTNLDLPTVVTQNTPVVENVADISSMGVKDIVDIKGIMYSLSGTLSYQTFNMCFLNVNSNAYNFVQCYVNKTTGKLVISSNSPDYNGRKANVTLQYTKTT